LDDRFCRKIGAPGSVAGHQEVVWASVARRKAVLARWDPEKRFTIAVSVEGEKRKNVCSYVVEFRDPHRSAKRPAIIGQVLTTSHGVRYRPSGERNDAFRIVFSM